MGTARRKGKRKTPQVSDKTLARLLKEHLSEDYPNPTREGCPPKAVLQRLAKQPQQADPSVVFHVFHCSPCYADCQKLLASLKSKPKITEAS